MNLANMLFLLAIFKIEHMLNALDQLTICMLKIPCEQAEKSVI